jgi:hypothetical protein
MKNYRLFPALFWCAIVLAPPASPGAQSVEYHAMVGRWSCVDRDTDGDVWRFTSVNAVYGAWLRLDATFFAQGGKPIGAAVTFLGYDSGAHRWIISAVQSGGSYYVRSSTSAQLNGSRWIDAYPTDKGTAILDLVSPQRYDFSFLQPRTNGKRFTSKVTCTRA